MESPLVSGVRPEADGCITGGDSFSGNERPGRHPEEVVGLEKLTGSKDLARRDLPLVDPRLERRQFGPGVGHAVVNRLPCLGRERVGVEWLSGHDAEPSKPGPEVDFGRVLRAELQREVQLVKEPQ